MTQYSWDDSPQPVRRRVEELTRRLREILGENFLGIYLHGSLAMGCFNPSRSDLDVLVVTQDPMAAGTKRRCVELLLRVSKAPAPTEVSFLVHEDLHPWHYPPAFDLHYSEMWRGEYENDLETGAWQQWSVGPRRTDVDLAAHITHLRDRGIVLLGPPIADVFPAVPPDDYLASILSDYESIRADIKRNPVYGVLNMIRVYRYLIEGKLSSKAEAGAWARTVLPPQERPVVEAALAEYQGCPGLRAMSPEALDRFADMMDRRIRPLVEHGPGAE